MKARKRSSSAAAVAGAMSVVMMFQACGGTDGRGPVMDAEQVRGLDGKELFRGLVLGRGPVAEHFPETWGDVDGRKSGVMEMGSAEVVKRLDVTAEYMRERAYPAETIARIEEASARLEDGTLALGLSREPEEMIESALLTAIEGADPTFFPRFREAMTSGDRLRIAAAFQEAITLGSEAAPALGYGIADRGDAELPVALAIVAVVFIAVVLVCCDPCLPSEDAMSPLNREDYIDQIARRIHPSRA